MDLLDPDFHNLSSRELEEVDRLCGEYERRRRAGEQLDPHTFCSRATGSLRSVAEQEIVRIELEILDGWDDSASIEPLVVCWPKLAPIIRSQWLQIYNEKLGSPTLPAPFPIPGSELNQAHSDGENIGGNHANLDPSLGLSPFDVQEEFRSGVVGSGARFQIIRHLAQGGIGNVFVAYDHDLRRDVALKELKLKFIDNANVLIRFRNEATITGLLEHPNIVPVYATGVRRDGRPFYAMRLIRGRTMHEAVLQLHSAAKEGGRSVDFRRDPSARDLLMRFIAVCKAIGFAHSRGVIHRDLKPGNIMVGDFGETLVVDWGLAKREKGDIVPVLEPEQHARSSFDKPLVEPDVPTEPSADDAAQTVYPETPQYRYSHSTVAGSVVGTPGFMSPEQAAGDIDRVTPASDIYSLGASLEFLLTGKLDADTRPYLYTGYQPVGTVVIVNREAPISPAAHRSNSIASLPAPLAAICRQAQHVDPMDRYISANRLAEDLESWLADEPVTVLNDSISVRMRRWARSRPALTGSVLSGLVIALIAMAVGLTVLSGKNESLRIANEREQEASRQALQNAKVAEVNSAEAIKQRQRVLGILNSFLVDVERGLERVPGGAAVQRNVLTRVLNELGAISKEFASDEGAQISNAMALVDLADLFVRCGKQDIDIELLGGDQKSTPIEAAQLMYSEAMRIVHTLDDKEHLEEDRADELNDLEATILLKQADVHLQQANTALALKDLNQALALRRDAADPESQADSESLLALIAVLDKIGQIQLQDGDLKQAAITFAEVRDLLKPMASDSEASVQVQRQWGIAHSRLADIADKNNELESAAELYAVDLAITKKLYESDATNGLFEGDLCISLDRLGNIQAKRGKIAEALQIYRESLNHRRTLSDAEPTDLRARRELFVSYMKCGDAEMMLSDVDGADKDYREALKTADQLATADGGSANSRRFQSLSLEVLADLALSRHDNVSALDFAVRSLDITRELAAKDTDNGQWQRDLLIGHAKVAKVHLAMESFQDALAELKQALKISEEIRTKNPESGLAARDVVFNRTRIAEVESAVGHYAEAVEACEVAIAILRSFPDSQMQDVTLRRRLVNTLTIHAQALVGLHRRDDAQRSLTEARELAEQMVALGQRAEQMQLDLKEIEKIQAAMDADENMP